MFIAFFVLNIYMVHFSDQKKIIEESRVFISPNRSVEHISFGFKEVISDLLWVRVIQDYGFCDQNFAGQSLDRMDPNRVHNCKKGWVYRMVDVITHLAPRFRIVYATGATILSVVVDDIEGATLIFEKGVAQFPKDWSLAYRAAYHYLYELEDKGRAGTLLLQASKHGGPEWLPSLAAKMYSESGKAELGKRVLLDFLKKYPGVEKREHFKKRLAFINKRLKQERLSKAIDKNK